MTSSRKKNPLEKSDRETDNNNKMAISAIKREIFYVSTFQIWKLPQRGGSDAATYLIDIGQCLHNYPKNVFNY